MILKKYTYCLVYNLRSFVGKFKLIRERELSFSKDSKMSDKNTKCKDSKILDRSLFTKSVTVPYLEANSLVPQLCRHLKKYLLKIDNIKPVQCLADVCIQQNAFAQIYSEGVTKPEKIIMLNPSLISSYADFEENCQAFLKKCNIIEENFKFCSIILTYDNFKLEEILKFYLPAEDNVTGFSKIGHIVHLNLKKHLLEYKYIIGQVMLDKVKNTRTVVNKVDTIDNTYRNFEMEVLCGDNDTFAQVKENKCVFEFDFSRVYWNPRLCSEHERVVNFLSEGDICYDIFAGVGPFAVPIAKKRCFVLANDLNPESVKWLKHNSGLNKVQDSIEIFNKDGRAFINNEIKSHMLKTWKNDDWKNNIHIIMNLPATAVTFLTAFHNLFDVTEVKNIAVTCPIIHVYCFVTNESSENEAILLVEEHLNCELKTNLKESFQVRRVAPNKTMFRVTFSLPKNVFINDKDISAEEPPSKKHCI